MTLDTADMKEEASDIIQTWTQLYIYVKDCSITDAFCKFVSDIFFKLSYLHHNKSTIHPHLMKDFLQYPISPMLLGPIMTKPYVFFTISCLSLFFQSPKPRGRVG